MKESFFTFADDGEWTTDGLNDRFRELNEKELKTLSTERRGQVNREMCHIAFEGLQRTREMNQREFEIRELNEKMGIASDTQVKLPGFQIKWKRQGQ